MDQSINYWKARIMIYLQAINYNLWSIVVKGPQSKSTFGGRTILKPSEEWDDKKLCSLGAKAMFTVV